jgi:hypothetical protein
MRISPTVLAKALNRAAELCGPVDNDPFKMNIVIHSPRRNAWAASSEIVLVTPNETTNE